jgi:hypothetical protein
MFCLVNAMAHVRGKKWLNEQLGESEETGKKKNPLQYHLVDHKYHMMSPAGPPW